MRSTITSTPQKNTTFDQGVLFQSKSSDLVVLCTGFSSVNQSCFSGVVIHSSTHSIGNTSNTWDKNNFIKFQGKIELEEK